MKEITRNILPFQENYFFSPIRRNIDYVKLLIYASRLILIDQQIPSNKNNCKMKLVIAKMSRLFFFKDQKYFSVAFPFKIYVEKNKVNGIETYGGKIVDNKSISGILAILNDTQFNLNNSLIEYYKELEDSETDSLTLLEEIYQFEPSYIRYDFDPIRVNKKSHPIHHLDINYSQYSTFKLGLDKRIAENHFENILDISSDCSFLKI